MGKLIFGGLLLFIAIILMVARSSGEQKSRPSGNLLRIFALLFTGLGAFIMLSALIVVIDPGQVGVKHAFGTVDPRPLLQFRCPPTDTPFEAPVVDGTHVRRM